MCDLCRVAVLMRMVAEWYRKMFADEFVKGQWGILYKKKINYIVIIMQLHSVCFKSAQS